MRQPRLAVVALAALAVVGLGFGSGSGSGFGVATVSAAARVTYTETMYLHNTGKSYTVGSVQTGGLVFNATKEATNNLGGVAPVWTFYYSLPVGGAVNFSGAVEAYFWLSSSVSAAYNWSTSLSWTNSAGTNLGTISTGGGTITVGTSPALYSLPMASVSPPISVGAGDLLKLVVSFSQKPATTDVVTLYMTSPASYLVFTLGSPPVSVGAPSFGRTPTASGGGGATFTFTVNDTLGLYDLQKVYAVVVQPGGYPYTVNVSPAGAVNPAGYSAKYQGEAEYLAGGVYTVYGRAQDGSGNVYSGAGSQLTVVPEGEGAVVWGVLVGLASLFTVLSFMLPLRTVEPTMEGWFAAGGVALVIRSFVFPLISSIIWFVTAFFSATLGVFISGGLIYLFYGLGILMFVVFFGLGFMFLRALITEPLNEARRMRGE